ncbi:hypothetical protein F5888DRAFT_1249103 [Russula emetica]|nr:hypothetical protein F5888DRAFT_1249103 [Russula emetica]
MSPSEGAVSSIKTFTSIPAEMTSHISSVGADISARSTISSFPPPPPPVDFSTISESSSKSSRPRPRPIFRRAGADPAPNASVSDPVFPHVPGSDHGDQFAIGSHSDPTVTGETTRNINPDLNNFSPDIAERAKMRARKVTKRSSPFAEEVIDITDDELAVTTPSRKPKERVKPRPIKRATPVGNNLQLNSDPVTVPVPSSSPLLPPSDTFPESTVINSTPPRPHPPVEAAAPDSPSPESPIQPRKRKRTVRLHSPVDNRPDPNCPPALPDGVTSPRSNSLPHSEGVVDVVDLGQNLNSNKKSSEDGYDMTETPKKRKSSKSAEKGSDSAAARPESSRVGKSKKKTIVEVVIMSPRKRRTESKKAKAKKKDSRNPEGNDTESRKDHRPSSPSPTEQTHRPIEDKNVHASRRQRSDSDDELILAPKQQPSSKVKPRKGKEKTREPRPVDSDALSEMNPSNVANGEEEEEEPRNDEHHAEGANTRTNEEHNSRTCAVEPESPAPLLVSLISISITSIANPV